MGNPKLWGQSHRIIFKQKIPGYCKYLSQDSVGSREATDCLGTLLTIAGCRWSVTPRLFKCHLRDGCDGVTTVLIWRAPTLFAALLPTNPRRVPMSQTPRLLVPCRLHIPTETTSRTRTEALLAFLRGISKSPNYTALDIILIGSFVLPKVHSVHTAFFQT